MRFRPRRWPGVRVGAGFLSLLLALDVWLVLYIAGRTPDLFSFLLGLLGVLTFPLLVTLSYGLYGFLTLTYDVNRNRVLIHSAASEWIIPLDRIARILQGSQLPHPIRWRGVKWPGYVGNRGEAQERLLFLLFATESQGRQLLLETSSQIYAISPSDPDGFLRALDVRRRMGALEIMTEEAHPARFLSWSVWGPRVLWWLILTGALANAVLFAYLCWRYPSLSSFLPLHFDTWGHADRIGTRDELFRLPLIGLLVLLVNGILGVVLSPRQRLASHLLLGGAIVVQVLLGVGLWALAG